MPTMVGNVSERHYKTLVREGRTLVEQQAHAQFGLGDLALKVAPMQPRGGEHSAEPLMSVGYGLARFSEDLGMPVKTLDTYRWVSSRWPKSERVKGISHYIHKILAGLDDRFDVIHRPPADDTGHDRWTVDTACRAAGWKSPIPKTRQEKLDRIHELANDDSIATEATKNFLNRPSVAFHAMADRTARHAVNTAQVEQSRQAIVCARQRTPAIPRIEHSAQYIELIAMCAQFVASAGRAVPHLRGHTFTVEERETVHTNIARVRSTADWIETAVDTGDVSLDEALARLLTEG